jgi:ferredoxin-type protein NapG
VDRRNFFRKGIQQLGRGVVKEVNRRADKRASRWIRPPYALDELDFLLACTRCNACIEACPHGVVFPLPVRCGATVAGTPALDLLNKACHLCKDLPCVVACEPRALRLLESDEDETPPLLPELALASIDPRHCLPYQGPECGACYGICPQPGALLWDGPRPHIDSNKCIGCALCRVACIEDPKAINIQSRQQGEDA